MTVLVDNTYKTLNISASESKAKETHQIIVFDDVEHAQHLAQHIGAQSIFEATDGFLVCVNGYFVTAFGWSGVLLDAKRIYNISWKLA